LDQEFDRGVTGFITHSQASSSRNNDPRAQLKRDVAGVLFTCRRSTMAVYSRDDSVQQQRALTSAEGALSRIQKCAEAAQAERITACEAVEQILDELAARPTLGRLRQALVRSAEPTRPH
jgi:hypothetical protein